LIHCKGAGRLQIFARRIREGLAVCSAATSREGQLNASEGIVSVLTETAQKTASAFPRRTSARRAPGAVVLSARATIFSAQHVRMLSASAPRVRVRIQRGCADVRVMGRSGLPICQSLTATPACGRRARVGWTLATPAGARQSALRTTIAYASRGIPRILGGSATRTSSRGSATGSPRENALVAGGRSVWTGSAFALLGLALTLLGGVCLLMLLATPFPLRSWTRPRFGR